jgi:hypothetical protein
MNNEPYEIALGEPATVPLVEKEQEKKENTPIDISDPKVKALMQQEYRTWKTTPRNDPNRKVLEKTWYQKYYGYSDEEYEKNRVKSWHESPASSIANFGEVMQNLGMGGQAMLDFGMDVLGELPGMGRVDDWYDQKTKYDDPIRQKFRSFLSVVIPSMVSTKAVAGKVTNMQLPLWQKRVVGTGLFSAQEAAVIGLSDVGEEPNIARIVSDTWPELFGPKGKRPIPDAFKSLDSHSTRYNKVLSGLDAAGFSIVGTALGAALHIGSGKKIMQWFEPLDDAAVKYKQLNLLDSAEPDKLIRMQQINEILSTKSLSKQNEDILLNELMAIEEELGVVSSFDDAVRRAELKRTEESLAAAKNKIDSGEQLEFDFDISPNVVSEAASARLSVPPGNVAKNMVDTTAIKTGATEGNPAPVITEAMQRKGLMVGPTSRGAVMGVAEEARDTGRFNAIVDGFRFGKKQMNAAAWDIYTSIIAAENMDDLRALFLENRDVKNMLLGTFKVEVFNEEQARAAAFAMRDLVDRYLGREVTESSARVMDTLGREAATIAESIQNFQGYVDDNHAMDLIIEKMQFLMDEYALNKYISGWQLRNKNWFDQVPPKKLDTVIEQLTQEFTSAENAIHAKNIRFTKELKRLKLENPAALRPLVDAYSHTNGDVDSLAKLMKWSAEQITPTGLLKSPDPNKLNLFTRGAWGVIYNNVLSGKAAISALKGNVYQLLAKPITGVLGHGIWGLSDDFEGLRRSFYYNGAVFETNRHALKDAFEMMKKAHKDPEAMMKSYRKDFVFQDDKAWDIVESTRPLWEAEGNWGRIYQYDAAKLLREMSYHPALRYGMTGMVFSDVFSTTHQAHFLSRLKAYDDVFSELGYFDETAILKAEKEHIKNFFDENGLPKDATLKAMTGEIQLNLDDGLATWLNKATTAYPVTKHMFMFPRTSSNWIKNSLSWTPLTLVPGINKYSKTLWAKTDDDIAQALLEHGIDMASTPNAKAIWKNLRAEYTGRLAFSGLLTKTLHDYAMGGNIRGNGHYNASRRQKERTEMGYEPKTIKVGNRWVSFKGIPGVEQVLTILGDISYYASDLDEAMIASWESKLTWTLAATFLGDSPLQGMEPLVAATNGDLSGWNRLVANAARSIIPMSGALGALNSSITSTLKDLEGEIGEFIANRLPIFSSTLPDQIDFWTGNSINDVNNPVLKVWNALSTIPVSEPVEPWRQWLIDVGWSGQSMLSKDSSGAYEYTAEERQQIVSYMGEEKLYKQIERLMKSKRYANEVENVRLYRASNAELDNERIILDLHDLPVYKEITQMVRMAQKRAELRLLNERPDIAHSIRMQKLVDSEMKQGNVEEAARIQGKELEDRQELETLLKINK